MEISRLEEFVDQHYRILRLDYGSERVYSIDYYARLEKEPPCYERLSSDNVTLCYVKLGFCEAVVSIVNSIVELISFRLVTSPDRDPAGGSPVKARGICIREASDIIGAHSP